jgi:hypothetical protein
MPEMCSISAWLSVPGDPTVSEPSRSAVTATATASARSSRWQNCQHRLLSAKHEQARRLEVPADDGVDTRAHQGGRAQHGDGEAGVRERHPGEYLLDLDQVADGSGVWCCDDWRVVRQRLGSARRSHRAPSRW